jgi:hypothetical protein
MGQSEREHSQELDDIGCLELVTENLNLAEPLSLSSQGSTTIYSRNVEHLHNLVFQALELISSNKEGKVHKLLCMMKSVTR